MLAAIVLMAIGLFAGMAVAKTFYGSPGSDNLVGTEQNDQMYGGNGNDAIYGRGSADRLYGQAQNDRLLVDACATGSRPSRAGINSTVVVVVTISTPARTVARWMLWMVAMGWTP